MAIIKRLKGRIRFFSKRGFAIVTPEEQLNVDVLIPRAVLCEYRKRHGDGSIPDRASVVMENVIMIPGVGYRCTELVSAVVPPTTDAWFPCIVKLFAEMRGYGFVVLEDGRDAFVHVSVLKRCMPGVKLPAVLPGCHFDVRVHNGGKGLAVTDIKERETA